MRRRLIATLALAAAMLLPAAPSAAPGARASASCAGDNASAPIVVRERAMLCLVNQARRKRGLLPLAAPDSLARAAGRKSGDILRCDDFSHEACGREFTYWIERVGYGGCAWAENIAWGSGSLGAPRSIFRAWMGSSGHRRNILGPFTDVGIGLQVGELEGTRGVHTWTQQFGSRDC